MRFLRFLEIALALTIVGLSEALAQGADDPVTVSCHVTKVTKNGPQNSQVQYAVFKTFTRAQKVKNELVSAISRADALGATGFEIEDAMKASGQTWKDSRPNGTFQERVLPGQAIVVLCDQEEVAFFEVVPGKTLYDIKVEMRRSIGEVEVVEKRVKHGINIETPPSIDTGYETRFTIRANFPKGWTRDDSRLIIQPMAIDCQTDDTVAYLTPMVYEGIEYHELQDRRMSFDYFQNDSLARAFHGSQMLSDGYPFMLDTVLVFRKPDKDRTYKGLFYMVLVDYHSAYYNNGGQGTGSCLAFKPFKFLDFSVASVDLNIADFRVEAESQFTTIPRNLKLNFDVGTDRLTEDSLNDVELDRLISELKSYGSRLFRVSVEGAASPEGNYETNKSLATRRAAKALSIIRNGLGPGADVQLPSPTVKVYTWDDVVDELSHNGTDTAIVAMVRNIVANNEQRRVYSALRELPFYESTIQPVLVNQRIMKCSYSYERDHVMTPEEAVEAYHTYKDDYIAGKRRFSDGDYYNLFATLKDSTDLDIITELAYKQITKQPSYEKLTFSPYVANKMAMLNMRRGIADLSVLAPFIDVTDARVPAITYEAGQKVTKNMPGIVINQAIAYFQEQKIDTAQALINIVPRSEVTDKLQNFIYFERYFIKYLGGQCTPEEEAKCDSAYEFVVESNEENKAIIFTELHQQLGNRRADVEPLVDKMDDKNAKKWYLKGILWCGEAGSEPPVGMAEDFQEISTEEYMRLQREDPEALARYEERYEQYLAAKAEASADKTPYFLAYFQHAFDLEPKFKRLYFSEGNVDDETRKKFPYRAKDVAAYRKKFERLYAAQQNAKKSADAAAAQPTAGDDASVQATSAAEQQSAAEQTSGEQTSATTPTTAN